MQNEHHFDARFDTLIDVLFGMAIMVTQYSSNYLKAKQS